MSPVDATTTPDNRRDAYDHNGAVQRALALAVNAVSRRVSVSGPSCPAPLSRATSVRKSHSAASSPIAAKSRCETPVPARGHPAGGTAAAEPTQERCHRHRPPRRAPTKAAGCRRATASFRQATGNSRASGIFPQILWDAVTVVPRNRPHGPREPGGGRQLPPKHRHQYS